MDKKRKVGKLRSAAKTKEITKAILAVGAMGGLAIIAGGGSHNPDKAVAVLGELGEYSKWRVNACLKRLKMQDYINYNEEDLHAPIIISKKGLERYRVLCLKDKMKLFSMKRWDHLWRLVTFDVKEIYRWKRDGFRRCLAKLDFYRLQKNVYVSPLPIEEDIEELIKSFKIYNACILHVADLGKQEEKIKKHFLMLNKK